MFYICINTATKTNEIFLIDDTHLITEMSWESERDESEKLLPNIQELLKNAKLDFRDLTHVFVVRGPGGFTSLRVGITIANTLAYALEIPIGGCTLFDWWDGQVEGVSDYVIVHSATKREMFVEGKGKYCGRFSSESIYKFSDFCDFLKKEKKVQIVGELMADHEKEVEEFVQKISFETEKIVGIVQGCKWEKGIAVEPFYGRMGQV